MQRAYEYEGYKPEAIITDPRVRKALIDAWKTFPDNPMQAPKIPRIKFLRDKVLMPLREAKDVIEYVEKRVHLLADWENNLGIRKFAIFQHVNEDSNMANATLVTSMEQLDVLKEFYSKMPSWVRTEFKLRIFTEDGVY